MTIQQLFEKFCAAKTHEIREGTLDKYRRNYKLHIEPTMANVRIDKLNVAMMQDWKLLIEQKGLALKSWKHAYSIFGAILNYAVKMEYIVKNPLSKAGNFKDAMSVRLEMSIYTAQEFTQYISTAKQLAEERQIQHRDLSEWDYYVFFSIAFYTGLRKGEVLGMRWSAINFENKTISINHKVIEVEEDGKFVPVGEDVLKTRSSHRTLPLIPAVEKKLLEEKEKQAMYRRLFKKSYCMAYADYVCVDQTGKLMRPNYVSEHFTWLLNKYELKRIRFHDLRHPYVKPALKKYFRTGLLFYSIYLHNQRALILFKLKLR